MGNDESTTRVYRKDLGALEKKVERLSVILEQTQEATNETRSDVKIAVSKMEEINRELSRGSEKFRGLESRMNAFEMRISEQERKEVDRLQGLFVGVLKWAVPTLAVLGSILYAASKGP